MDEKNYIYLNYFAIILGTTNTSPWLGKFCGKTALPIMTTGTIMTIHFHSDNTKIAKGFYAEYFIGEKISLRLQIKVIKNINVSG